MYCTEDVSKSANNEEISWKWMLPYHVRIQTLIATEVSAYHKESVKFSVDCLKLLSTTKPLYLFVVT